MNPYFDHPAAGDEPRYCGCGCGALILPSAIHEAVDGHLRRIEAALDSDAQLAKLPALRDFLRAEARGIRAWLWLRPLAGSKRTSSQPVMPNISPDEGGPENG